MLGKKYKSKSFKGIRKIYSYKLAEVNTLKFCGTVKFNEDALLIQKKLRNEWK